MVRRKLISPDKLPDYGVVIGDDQRKNLEAKGQFPKRVRVTARSHAYVEDEIVRYTEERIAERDRQTGQAA